MAGSGVKAPGFTGAAIDRADHLRLQPERIEQLAAGPDARLLTLSGLDPVLDGDGLCWAPLADLPADAELLFLGFGPKGPLFAPLLPQPPGQRAWSVFRLLEVMPSEEAALWGTARSLIEWHSRHPFCSACGGRSLIFRAGWGRKCPNCSTEHYPRVDPVVIMLAEHEGRVLLGRQHQYPAGRYSALAGFVEPGESLEEAVARELKEEAGIDAANVRYVASQPWPFPGSLMIACIADAASDALTLDETELEDAFWADRAEVAAALGGEPGARFAPPPHFAIAHSLLTHWLAAA
jgi:NAD+ diphosphatase